MDDLDDDELSQQHAWSITARLAAIDVNREEGLSAELKGLIAEAQGLHPTMVQVGGNG